VSRETGWRAGCLCVLNLRGAATLHFFVKGTDLPLLFFRADFCSHKCPDIVGLGKAARGDFLAGFGKSELVVILREAKNPSRFKTKD
jgi:hypothetical protein